ncbi:MAG: acylneuraminate cytidylyltransferase family protein [Candidatus Omnitrophica bacterium]|nr:acylneuraminate cytidylyltransferase family protein [Candidatus Omnitrophota bacterium]
MAHIICIVPARGGSKSIPKKNIVDFCGKPLIAWTIRQALESSLIDDVYVTTDDDTIAAVSEKYGAKVIRRPKRLSTDTASSEDALMHALSEIEKRGAGIDLVVFLQATSPLRRAKDIDMAIAQFRATKADSMFSAAILEDYTIWKKIGPRLKSVSFNYKERGRRQDREPLYLENGSIYLFKPEILKRCKNRLGGRMRMYIMDFWRSYEIDNAEDLKVCEYFMKNNILKKRG